MDRIQLQRAEFDAAFEFRNAVNEIGQVAVVDDDYPLVRNRYEGALHRLLEAVKANRPTVQEQPIQVPGVDEVIRISTNMRNHGGSFAQALGRALGVADSTNLRKIIQTWPELVSKYASTSWR